METTGEEDFTGSGLSISKSGVRDIHLLIRIAQDRNKWRQVVKCLPPFWWTPTGFLPGVWWWWWLFVYFTFSFSCVWRGVVLYKSATLCLKTLAISQLLYLADQLHSPSIRTHYASRSPYKHLLQVSLMQVSPNTQFSRSTLSGAHSVPTYNSFLASLAFLSIIHNKFNDKLFLYIIR